MMLATIQAEFGMTLSMESKRLGKILKNSFQISATISEKFGIQSAIS